MESGEGGPKPSEMRSSFTPKVEKPPKVATAPKAERPKVPRASRAPRTYEPVHPGMPDVLADMMTAKQPDKPKVPKPAAPPVSEVANNAKINQEAAEAQAAAASKPKEKPEDKPAEGPVTFTPEHPFGPEAASGKLPDTDIKPEQDTAYLREIPPGMNQNDLIAWTENILRAAEQSASLYDPQYTANLAKLFGEYRFSTPYTPVFDDALINPATGTLGRNKSEAEFKGDLAKKVTIRGGLVRIQGEISARSWDGYAEGLRDVVWKDNIRVLLSEKSPMGERAYEKVARMMSARLTPGGSAGAYWREVDDPATGDYPPGSLHEQVDTYLESQYPGDPESQHVVKSTLENLYDALGMTAQYTGPIDTATGRLVDELIIEQMRTEAAIPSTTSAPNPYYNPRFDTTFSDGKFMKNERYWQLWAEARERNGGPLPTPSTIPGVRGPDTPVLRRIYYCPEYQVSENAKARDLIGAAELYVRPFTHYNGLSSIDDLFDIALNKSALADSSGRPLIRTEFRYVVGRFAQQVSGAGKALSKMNAFLNEPMGGGANAGKDLNHDLKGMLEVVQAFDGYLRSGDPTVLYYGTAKLVENTFNYVNGNSPSRKREFGKLPSFGPVTQNAVFNALHDFIDHHHRDEALARIGATDQLVRSLHSSENSRGFGMDVLKLFGDFFKGVGGLK